MSPNLLNTRFIAQIIRRHHYFTATFEQVEMICSRFVREAHGMISPLGDSFRPHALLGLKGPLSYCRREKYVEQENEKGGPHGSWSFLVSDSWSLSHSLANRFSSARNRVRFSIWLFT